MFKRFNLPENFTMYRGLNRLLIFLIIPFFSAQAQYSPEFEVNLEAGGFYSQDNELPFWLYSNRKGLVDRETNFYTLAGVSFEIDLYEGIMLKAGGTGVYREGFDSSVYADELFVQGYGRYLDLLVGKRHEAIAFDGLSASNGHILNSLNSRAFPGIKLSSAAPIFFGAQERFGFEFEFAEYILNDERTVESTRVHNKSLHFIYAPNSSLSFRIGAEHYAQWGGTSNAEGKLPGDFEDYLKILYAGKGDADAPVVDQQVALGNHLGSYMLEANYDTQNYYFTFFINTIFDDPKGSSLGNAPDGQYGFYMRAKEDHTWIRSAMYELYYTRNQSNHLDLDNSSDYFNNSVYKSGWTYNNQIIGAPFFDYSEELNRVVNNKFIAHHLGFQGDFLTYGEKYPFRVLASYTRKDGTYNDKFYPNLDEYYLFNEVGFITKWLDVKLNLAVELSQQAGPKFGTGIVLSKTFL